MLQTVLMIIDVNADMERMVNMFTLFVELVFKLTNRGIANGQNKVELKPSFIFPNHV